jgi:hypothetical protein
MDGERERVGREGGRERGWTQAGVVMEERKRGREEGVIGCAI